MKRLILFLFILSSFSIGYSQTFIKLESEIIIRKNYLTIYYDTLINRPECVVYTLKNDYIKGEAIRNDCKWKTDLSLSKSHRITSKMYNSSGFDRGHLAPAADFKFSQEAMQETFFMTNIVPQEKDLNQRSWKYLEDYIRDLSVSYDSIRVFTGVYGELGKIRNKVSIPEKCWKAIFLWKKGKIIDTDAWIYDNKPKNQQHNRTVSLDELEKIIGREIKRGK